MCLQDVLILDIVGFSFARQTVLAGVRVESSAKVLQVMHQFVNDQAGDEPGIVVMILRVDVNDVFVVVPAHRIALASATHAFHEKTVGLKTNRRWLCRLGVSRQVHRPAQQNR